MSIFKKEKKELTTAQKLKSNKKKRLIRTISLVTVAAVGIGAFSLFNKPKAPPISTLVTDVPVEKRDITVTLSGTGTLKPADAYSVSALVKGEILNSPFEEGDIVTKGDKLFSIDPSDAENSIERSSLNLEKAKLSHSDLLKNLKDLNVKATEGGKVQKVYVKVGDTLQVGSKIADILDSSTMILNVMFNSSDVENIFVGDSASVTLDQSFETIYGTVQEVSTIDEVLPGGMLVRKVKIAVTNPGGLSTSQQATAVINGMACNTGGTFEYNSQFTITAKSGGEIESLDISEGQVITKDQVVATLSGTSVETQIKNSQLSLRDAQLALDNLYTQRDSYEITSPISGTVISKNYKTGDTLDSSTANKAMAEIYDLSSLKFDLNIDELDIGLISVGQDVQITAEAVPGKGFTGKITKVGINGTSQNGVTTYPVTIEITETEGLLPGMNITAKIVVQSVKNVLSLPVSAVNRGNVVFIKDDGAISGTADDSQNAPSYAKVPDGYKAVPITVGLNDETHIEITSGLNEGDTVGLVTSSGSSSNVGMFPGGGSGEVVMIPAGGGAMAVPSGPPPSGGAATRGGK